MSDEKQLVLMAEIRDWVRVAAYPGVKRMLEEALPDTVSRKAYQMCDGKNSRDAICRTCRIGKETLPAIQKRCIALGLMKDSDGRKIRVFNLEDFGLIAGAL